MLNLDTGLVRIPITRDGEQTGEIKFNPNELGFIERFYGLLSEFDVKEREYQSRNAELDKNQEIDTYGVPVNTKERLALLREICEYVKGKIDYVFGEGTSQIAFGNAITLEMFTQFLDGVTPYIQKARNAKTSKYTSSGAKNVMK